MATTTADILQDAANEKAEGDKNAVLVQNAVGLFQAITAALASLKQQLANALAAGGQVTPAMQAQLDAAHASLVSGLAGLVSSDKALGDATVAATPVP